MIMNDSWDQRTIINYHFLFYWGFRNKSGCQTRRARCLFCLPLKDSEKRYVTHDSSAQNYVENMEDYNTKKAIRDVLLLKQFLTNGKHHTH